MECDTRSTVLDRAHRARGLAPGLAFLAAAAAAAVGAPTAAAAGVAAGTWFATDAAAGAVIKLVGGPVRGEETSASRL